MTAIHTLDISGIACVVMVRQKSMRIWVAHGNYMSAPIRVEDQSEEAALIRWQEAATSEASSAKPRPEAKRKQSSPGRSRKKKVGAGKQSRSAKAPRARKKPAQRK